MQYIRGIIEKIFFVNENSHTFIAKVRMDYLKHKELLEIKKILFSRDVNVISPFLNKPVIGDEWEFFGTLSFDRDHGYAFNAERGNLVIDKTKEGLIKFLSSSSFPGIGPTKAKMLVDKLGTDILERIVSDKSVLDGLKLTTDEKTMIFSQLSATKEQNEVISALLGYNITFSMANKLYDEYKENTLDLIKKNPYLICEKILHFSFLKADELFLKFNVDKESPTRLKAALIYLLEKETNATGNVGISKFFIFRKLENLLRIPLSGLDEIVAELVLENKCFLEEDYLFLSRFYLAENAIANFLLTLLEKDGLIKNDTFIKNYLEKKIHFTYDFDQIDAIRNALSKSISIITGGPGTGKTQVIKAIAEIGLTKFSEENIALLAPTGRASKRLEESTLLKSQTIHRFLGYRGEGAFAYDFTDYSCIKFLIIDEFSMVDTLLFKELLMVLGDDVKMVLVGDVDQLPSVGAGALLSDLIQTKQIPTTVLKTIYRQKDGSKIAQLAVNIKEGEINKENLNNKDVEYFCLEEAHVLERVIDITKSLILNKVDIFRDFQILIPMYKGINGISNVNSVLQDQFNQNTKYKLNDSTFFKKGDKVLQLNNRPEKDVMNGDLGIISDLFVDNEKITKICVNFFSGHQVEYRGDELYDLSLAYAISIHKAQGSEFPFVLVPFSKNHFFLLKKKLIYTAVTRAKSHLYLLGDLEVFMKGIRETEPKRKTRLKDIIVKTST